uniref:Kinase D-interacting substrate of 220 kDa n=1 Tax=Cacopsylla melanoneura TaxID=428564 RepID=A0A8D8VMQ1_9HEMI
MGSSTESIPLTLTWGSQRNYGSIFSFYHFFRNSTASSLINEIKNLPRSESMVSLCYRTLQSYIAEDNLESLQNFLENKRTVTDDRDDNGGTALMFAASKGKLAFVRTLVNRDADVNAEDSDNWSPLTYAAKEGHTDVCAELLDHGAELDHRDMGGWSPLMWASYKGHTETVALLLEKNADVNAHGNYHISSLIWAAGRGYTEIVSLLVKKNAKVNVGDKYGTTPLVWACRKGHTEIVDILLKAGSNVDVAGLYCWTPLLVATLGNFAEVVELLLEYKPNVNALDKDGCTALTIACKDGYYEIAVALINAGAYINIQDRSGDSNLIHAVKGGHRGIVEALLKKYVDVDIPGKERKTAVYTAVEKGNVSSLKLLLTANPDLEIATKDGDTPLLKAVKTRNIEAIQLLIDKKAKITAVDKRGDTVLHIAMRARSKTIVEMFIRNPKNNILLYRPNKAGETPYSIDMNNQKSILAQVLGARRLNTSEDNENLLGYDLYSSALADIFSEPALATPLTVGLYAKWGSGKSFLLPKLKDEMKHFERQGVDPTFSFSFLLFSLVVHLSVFIGLILGLSLMSVHAGLLGCLSTGIIIYTGFSLLVLADKKPSWNWPAICCLTLQKKLNSLQLILHMMFCHPPSLLLNDSSNLVPLRFYFTDQARVSSTAGGENYIVQMIGSLYDSLERDCGSLSTRLFRALQPKPIKSSTGRWRSVCCVPYVIIFELSLACVLIALSIFVVHKREAHLDPSLKSLNDTEASVFGFGALLVVVLAVLFNLPLFGRLFQSLLFSQRTQLQRAVSNLDTLKSEGFLQALRSEVNLLIDMTRCMDGFMSQHTRLVIIVDGLDSCEQDKVLLVLDVIHVLLLDVNQPFIIILSIDPHVLSKAVDANSRRLFSESNISGYDYLRNLVHLPFYLQNSGLRKLRVAHRASQSSSQRKSISNTVYDDNTLHPSASSRKLSADLAGGFGGVNSMEKLRASQYGSQSGLGGRSKGSRKLKVSESIASSIGSNMNKVGASDVTKMLLTDDYFSDVTPRTMRRLLNVVSVTGRLLKAFQMEFSWYRLATWINMTEQWPFRMSYLIFFHETTEELIDDNMTLQALFEKVRPQIPISKEAEPFLELDRDEKKFDHYLNYHRSHLHVSDLRVFLPFSINLDPFIKKVIKEDIQNYEEATGGPGFATQSGPGGTLQSPFRNMAQSLPPWIQPQPTHTLTGQDSVNWNLAANRKTGLLRRQRSFSRPQIPAPPTLMYQAPVMWPPSSHQSWITPQMPPSQAEMVTHPPSASLRPPMPVSQSIPPELQSVKLSILSIDGVSGLLDKIPELRRTQVAEYKTLIQQNNVSGRVLLHCDLNELKKVLNMNFGDWELFKMMIVSLREYESCASSVTTTDETTCTNRVKFNAQKSSGSSGSSEQKKPVAVQSSGTVPVQGLPPSGSNTQGDARSATVESNAQRAMKQQSVIEKQKLYQVSLEEQMICGALQTLNEEACEDVLEELMEDQVGVVSLSNPNVAEQPPDITAQCMKGRPRTLSQGSCLSDRGLDETEMLLVQNSPLHHLLYTPVNPSTCFTVTQESPMATPLSSRKASLDSRILYEPGTSGLSRLNSRPSSMLLMKIDDFDESQQQQTSLVEDKTPVAPINNSSRAVLAPAVRITPASSLEEISRKQPSTNTRSYQNSDTQYTHSLENIAKKSNFSIGPPPAPADSTAAVTVDNQQDGNHTTSSSSTTSRKYSFTPSETRNVMSENMENMSRNSSYSRVEEALAGISLESINRNSNNRGQDDSDDESTPLVSDVSSPLSETGSNKFRGGNNFDLEDSVSICSGSTTRLRRYSHHESQISLKTIDWEQPETTV